MLGFKKLLLGLAVATPMVFSTMAHAEKQIRIVGSSTVYPFTTMVAERFGRKSGFKTPIVESTGTGGGMKIFCTVKGSNSADFTNASRQIKPKEIKLCKENGFTVTELTVGIDGIVVANSNKKPALSITVAQLYLALAKKVKIDGKMVDNPYKKWSDIDASLPNKKIEIMGPPPSSGTRDALISLVMKKGAKSFGIKEKKYYKVLREDGHFIEAGENDNLIVRKLTGNPNMYGIFGYSFLEENRSILNSAKINGVEAEYETIANFEYPVARYLFVYIKRENVDKTPGMRKFIEEYMSDDALDDDGYLAEKGLIAMPIKKRTAVRDEVLNLKVKK